MTKVRLILMFQGRIEHDIETEMLRPRLKEMITLHECGRHYKIKFIQHMFNDKGEFESLMVTAVKRI